MSKTDRWLYADAGHRQRKHDDLEAAMREVDWRFSRWVRAFVERTAEAVYREFERRRNIGRAE